MKGVTADLVGCQCEPFAPVEGTNRCGTCKLVLRREADGVGEHEHRFNATIVERAGRCSCGAWARWNRGEFGRWGWGAPIKYEPMIKAMETRLRRAQDPDHAYPKHAAEPTAPAERRMPGLHDLRNGVALTTRIKDAP